MTIMTIEKRIELLIEKLDIDKPGWFNIVNLDILDFWSVKYCLLAQLYGSYNEPHSRLIGKIAIENPLAGITSTNEYREQWKIAILKKREESKR